MHTVPNPGGSGWVNTHAGEVVSRHRRQEKAVERGRAIARRLGTSHTVHARDGTVVKQASYTGEAGRGGRKPQVREGAGAARSKDFYVLRLESARRAFPSDAQVADALGVNRAQVKRWREGVTEPGLENGDRVVALDTVVELLAGYLEPGSIRKWLMGINAHLGDRRPIDMVRQGNLSDVIAAIEALKSGSYA